MKTKKLEISLISIFVLIFITSFVLTLIFPKGYIYGGDYEYLITIILSFALLLWGISMIYRSQYKKQRTYIIVLVISFFFWIILRFIKWLPNIHYVSIYADYFYYVPMLLIPIVFFMMTMDTFFPDFKKKKIIYIIIIALAYLLVLLVLTNELHFLVYRDFKTTPTDDPNIEIITSQHGPLHYVALGFVGLVSLGALITFIFGSRKQLSLKQLFVVSFSFVLLIIYIVLFTIGILSKTPFLRDFATCIAILLTLLLELLLDIGLIQNNGKYISNFLKSSIGMCIYDENNKAIYKTSTFDKDKKEIKISNKEIGLYKVQIIEDLSSISTLKDEIKNESKEIEKANDNLKKLINITKEETSVKYRLSLMDEIENSITVTKNEIISLTNTLPDKMDDSSKKMLGYIETLLGYMKQKCMLLLRAKEETYLTNESFILLNKVISEDIKSSGYSDVVINVVDKSDIDISLASTFNDFIHSAAKTYRFTNSVLFIAINVQNKTCRINVINKKIKPINIDFSLNKITSKQTEDGVSIIMEVDHE